VHARRRHEAGEAFEQGRGGEHELPGSIGLRGLELVSEEVARAFVEPAVRDRAAKCISAEALDRDALVGGEGGGGVQVEAIDAGVHAFV